MKASSSNIPKNKIQIGFTKPEGLEFIERMPDSEIWEEFKNGNEGAFNHIYLKYFQELYGYGQQFTSDFGLIKDLLQDLFIDLRKNRKRLGPTSSIKFYLFKSIRRKIVRYLKRKNTIYFSDMEPFSNIEFEKSYELKYLKDQLDENKKALIKQAFSKLSRRQKEAVFYYFYHEMSYEEVTSIMGFRNVKSTRNLIYKAIDSLKTSTRHQKSKFFN